MIVDYFTVFLNFTYCIYYFSSLYMIFIRRVGRRVLVRTHNVVVCICVMYIRHMMIIIIIVVILIYDDNHHEPRRYKIFTTPVMYRTNGAGGPMLARHSPAEYSPGIRLFGYKIIVYIYINT